MIPNLTLIVGVYVVIRLAMNALRQHPKLAERDATRGIVAAASVLGIILVTICTLDTIGVGLSVGSSIDSKRPPPWQR